MKQNSNRNEDEQAKTLMLNSAMYFMFSFFFQIVTLFLCDMIAFLGLLERIQSS